MSAALEKRVTTALAAEATSSDLAALIQETEAGIIAADQTAADERERAFDPALSPDPGEARAAMENAIFAASRLRTLLPRLQTKRAEVEAAQRLAKWEAEFAELKEQREALADELDTYPAIVGKLTNLFIRITVFDAKLSKLHQSRPSGIRLHLDSVELTARNLAAFGRDLPSIIKATVLHDFDTGKQKWPPVVPRDMSLFAPISDPRASRDWYKFKEADAAHARAENQRFADYYAQQERERKARDKQEDKRS